ncbi:hypothetical protein Q4489_18120 [Thalassotalea sp. 1_MG-2023]|uniref:hypothetical protein n=1 Tax=Thalassotalea sp. 1_MG-2023 TaxID=3062680 RepID=UPI0026E1B3C0|nr:hypothetical protein [Thalassotalea sp. 1_MG-2023]MDO6428919.1 hypothetical protein [Thalassotalea sp. 1_MG-2023]
MNKSIFLNLLFIILIIVANNAHASNYFTASKTRLNMGEDTLLSWSNYYPNLYNNPTYNLYVYKPNGAIKYKFGSGLTDTSFLRKNIRMSGKHTFEVEVCDSLGENCVTNYNGRVSVYVDHGCYKDEIWSGIVYKCDGQIVSQSTGGVSHYGVDKFSEFIAVKDRVFWYFWDASMLRGAYYTNCRSGGSLSMVTAFVGGLGISDRIDNFLPKTDGENAEWDHWHKVGSYFTHHSSYLGQC